MSKANWSSEMTTIFCKLAAIEKLKGNRPQKFLNPAGYKNVEVGFLQQTGKLYSRLQFKNKWGSLRTLYRDWLILKNTSTGLGWNDETNTVIADDEWWKKAGEENKDFLQFRKCGPENLEQMSIMYENINVTGESSMMPGCAHEVENTVGTEIEKIMEDVVACGADEESDEYFIATKLFAKFENRCFFNNMKTSEGKKNWLRRMYEDRNRR